MSARREPIPKYSVSIYFSIDVSKIEPKVKQNEQFENFSFENLQETPVKVSFVFETMRSIYRPENFQFSPFWFENIVRLKKTYDED